MSTKEDRLKFKIGKKIKYDEVIIKLHNFGYERVSGVLDFGKFSAIGDSIKIYSAENQNPISITLWGNEIESINIFSLVNGKKISQLDQIVIFNNFLFGHEIIIKPGNLVVHEDHGIGVFRGKVRKKIGTTEQILYSIEYLNNDRLFVPEKSKDKITAYQGVGRKNPRLSRLGSSVWLKTKKKVEQSIYLLARELLQIYAKRELIKKEKTIKIDKNWDQKLANTFEHVETKDQEIAISEIYQDLEKNSPMDRLLIGDVGFGKTEVAIRAATQVINNGKQVVILAPTTILSRQHFKTIEKRLESFPINIAELSRFVPLSDQQRIITGLKTGSIDLLVGTHKILSSSIRFKNLGLLIIDEEQKFGVKDKEKLKLLKNDIDVLSMSATPIPRTLFVSLSGIRQISVIKTPPQNRKPILTTIEEYNENKVLEYIKKEIVRKGQVYFLHNDVKTIQHRTEKLKTMLPSIKIAYAHGQMPEDNLSSVMAQFAAGEIDLLVCSTIIENGLDIPNVNTLIIDDAEKFGLSQLYQLRGRIGRGMNQAYAYITFRKKISGNAFKRFKALTEKTDLGSGFDVAFSDLEIRGGGNILGREQHGNMEELGLVLYTKLLNLAVEKLKMSNKNY